MFTKHLIFLPFFLIILSCYQLSINPGIQPVIPTVTAINSRALVPDCRQRLHHRRGGGGGGVGGHSGIAWIPTAKHQHGNLGTVCLSKCKKKKGGGKQLQANDLIGAVTSVCFHSTFTTLFVWPMSVFREHCDLQKQGCMVKENLGADSFQNKGLWFANGYLSSKSQCPPPTSSPSPRGLHLLCVSPAYIYTNVQPKLFVAIDYAIQY